MRDIDFLKAHNLDCEKPLPNHVAIIMDGNGRWAKNQGLIRLAGHRAGAKIIRNILETVKKLGIEYLTVFAFSTENWKRPKDEVDGLMSLLVEFMNKELDNLNQENIRVNILGNVSKLPQKARMTLENAQNVTENNTSCTFNIALNYGGREEILTGVKAFADDYKSGRKSLDDLDEMLFSDYLYTKGQPDPDLLIRTSGELRISNFLLWQIAYSEIWVTPVLWPDFREENLIEAIHAYQNRNRRFGGLK